MCEIFSNVPLKELVTRENCEKLNFYFGMIKFGKIDVLVNFIIQKMKGKRLVCLSFLWGQVF